MANGLHGDGLPVAVVCVLALAASSMGATAPPACDFQPECRPGETYRLPIPCEGKCAYYIQCADGVAAEKKCGKYFWHQNQFDAVKLDCIRETDCSWWTKTSTTTSTTTTTPTVAPTTPAPETTPSSSTTTETSTSSSSSTEFTSTTVTPAPTAPTSTTEAEPTPTPSESAAAAPVAIAGLTVLTAALALLL